MEVQQEGSDDVRVGLGDVLPQLVVTLLDAVPLSLSLGAVRGVETVREERLDRARLDGGFVGQAEAPRADVSTAGPPRTRTISAVDPPSSETGMTCMTLLVSSMRSSTMPLKAVPPVKAMREG